jgi:hypothetical protein
MRNILPPLISILSLVLLPLLFSSCEKEDVLPPITAVGKNTFGCLVDGAIWIPKGRALQGAFLIEMQHPKDTMVINIYADDSKTNSGMTISIHDTPTFEIGKSYSLQNEKFYVVYNQRKNDRVCYYEKVIDGNIKLLKFEPDSRVIAGTFEFTVYSQDCSDTVKVTEGRFDIGEIIR